jgi:hypothetical protein
MTPDFRLHVIAAADEEVCLTQNVQMVKARVFTENPYLLKTPSQFFTANEVLALLMHLLLLPHDETVLEIGKSSMTSTWNIFCIQNKEGVPCAVVVEWDYYRDQYYLDAFPIAKPISGIFKKIAVFEKR